MMLEFVGIDGWDRAVFRSEDGKKWFKSVYPFLEDDFDELPTEEQESFLENMHDTDGFDGEPGFPVPRDTFKVRTGRPGAPVIL